MRELLEPLEELLKRYQEEIKKIDWKENISIVKRAFKLSDEIEEIENEITLYTEMIKDRISRLERHYDI